MNIKTNIFHKDKSMFQIINYIFANVMVQKRNYVTKTNLMTMRQSN